MSEAKRLDLQKDKTFTANGNKYFVSNTISISRWKEYEKLEPRLTYGIGFSDIFKQLNKIWDCLNDKTGKIAEAAVTVHNLMNGIKDVEAGTREHPALLMAALVINKEGEDVGTYDESIQLSKIEDWKTEGYDVLPFFLFALSSIQGFRETYVEYITKEMEKTIEKKQ